MKTATKNSGRWAPFRKLGTALLLLALLSTARSAEPVLLLDPGHGGSDSGARGPGGSEASFVLKTALALEPLLSAAGVPVKLSRRTEEAPPQRLRFTGPQGSEVRIVISLHLSGGEGLKPGTRLYFCPAPSAGAEAVGPFRPWGPSPDLAARSQRLAESLAAIAGLLGPRVLPLPGGATESCPAPAVILELGGLSETILGGGELDPASAAAAWRPFLSQLWSEWRP